MWNINEAHSVCLCANMLRVKNKLFGDPHEILCEDLLLIILVRNNYKKIASPFYIIMLISVWKEKIELIFINIFNKYSLCSWPFLRLCGFFAQSLCSDQRHDLHSSFILFTVFHLFHTLNETFFSGKIDFSPLADKQMCFSTISINIIVTLEISLCLFFMRVCVCVFLTQTCE
jgi:hypothetical protein